MPCRLWHRQLLFAALTLLLAAGPHASAQHGGHGMGSGGMGMGPAPGFAAGYGPRTYGNGSHMPDGPPPGGPDSAGTVGGMRSGMHLGPPGRWWDDKHFAKDLKLRPDQQRRMDTIFEANRPALLTRLGIVQQEEMRMDGLVHSKNPDEATLNAEIDRVWQARAELEKAKTHFLLQIRQEMDADQLARLEERR